jgi:hypothetical protein
MATSAANPALAPDDPLRVSPVKCRALGGTGENILMRVARLKSLLSKISVPAILVVALLFWNIRSMHHNGTSYLEIALTITAVGALGILALFLATFFFSRVPEPSITYGDGARHAGVDFSSPLNLGVLEYLRNSRPKRKAELESASPASIKNPLSKTGTHPEIGVRLWEELATSLPVDCRWIVCGTPALVHPKTGVLFGVGIGMAYCLRLTDADMEGALQAGASTQTKFSGGRTLDLASHFGPGWVFGSWQQAELEWCRAEYEALGKAAEEKAILEKGVS